MSRSAFDRYCSRRSYGHGHVYRAERDAPAFGSVASSVLGESGITYTNIAVTDDGATVTTRKISHEEFVAGILAPHHPHTHTKE